MLRPSQAALLIFSAAGAIAGTSVAAEGEVLTTASAVLSLTPDEAARGIRVSVTGMVTAAEADWGGRFFVQDSTGGVFVNNEKEPQPVPGDLVQVSGTSHLGGYAPDVIWPHWKKLGSTPLPQAKAVSAEQLMSGTEDGQRVEVSGVVRSAERGQKGLALELVSGGYRFRAFSLVSTNLNPNSMVGATVRVRGTAAAAFNYPLRHLLTVVMFVPQEADFIIDQLPDAAVSQEPLVPLNAIAQYRRSASPNARIRVKGVVTYQRSGKDIFLHDETGGLQVKCRETNTLAPGEVVEAVGFPVVERLLPVLQDAILSRKNESEGPVVPQKVSVPVLLEGLHHSDLVSLRGKLLDISLRPLRPAASVSWTKEYILTLQSSNDLFSVEAPVTTQFAELGSIPIGSTLEVSGVCMLQAGGADRIESVQLLPPDAASIRILQRPGWWTRKRLLIGFGIVLLASFVGITWSVTILRKNSALKLSIAENIKARDELQEAHNLLESRVEERTRQLKSEMSARNEAEVQVKAILAERTRIAQELHDTLLQGFTGIGLKLDAVTSSLPASLAAAKGQLQQILERSDEYLVEARRAVWELRSPSLETLGDFSKVLMQVCERALQGTGIQLRFTTDGVAGKPGQVIEDNLLRICEEALANAVQHAHPTQVEVNLEYTPEELRLQIRDNGCGFDPSGPDASKDGHFGLVGIRERAKAIGGHLALNSKPGQGAEIEVKVPACGEKL